MSKWIEFNLTGSADEVKNMPDLLSCMRDYCVKNQDEWETVALPSALPSALPVAVAGTTSSEPQRPRRKSVNWNRKLEVFKQQQTEDIRLEEEENAARVAEAESESILTRTRTAEIAAAHKAEFDAAKAAKKAGVPWGARGSSMADKLKSAWAAALPVTEEQ